MLPLIPLALAVVPELIKALAGDRAGTVAGQVATVVQQVTGTASAAEAQERLASDPALATTLRVRLAEIALESRKAADLAAEQRRQSELAEIQKALESTQGARTAMTGLVQAGSAIAWGAPTVSVLVTVGFFVFLIALMTGGVHAAPGDSNVVNIVNMAVGALATAFATVVNFWLGSSMGSRSKDDSVNRMQELAIGAVRAPAPPAAPPPATAPPGAAGDSLFAQCLAVVLDKEGGFADQPADRGGPTNMGITWRTLADWRGLAADELSPDGRAHLIDDLRALTRREAGEIYRANYWLPMRCGDLPPAAAMMTFDFGVNAGPRTAVKLLQRVIGVTDDGALGPRTLAAVQAIDPATLVDQLAAARLAYYRGLADFPSFGAGWVARTEQVAALARALRG
ncbi:MAG: glycoside hydrolase family 108 protein [Acetobacteraceae bacterium]|nr:glycoside hydrolase family 108 protein [Acetobacteraceae bacterium]